MKERIKNENASGGDDVQNAGWREKAADQKEGKENGTARSERGESMGTDVGRNHDVHLFESCFKAHAYAPVTKTRGCGHGKCAR